MPADISNRLPLERLNAQQIQSELVGDAVKRTATPLRRFLPAIERLAELRKKDPEEVYQDLLDEVQALTGKRWMPIA